MGRPWVEIRTLDHHTSKYIYSGLCTVSARFSPEVSPICLPGRTDQYNDDLQCIISGWGKTKRKTHYNLLFSDLSKVVFLKVFSYEKSEGAILLPVCAFYACGFT